MSWILLTGFLLTFSRTSLLTAGVRTDEVTLLKLVLGLSVPPITFDSMVDYLSFIDSIFVFLEADLPSFDTSVSVTEGLKR